MIVSFLSGIKCPYRSLAPPFPLVCPRQGASPNPGDVSCGFSFPRSPWVTAVFLAGCDYVGTSQERLRSVGVRIEIHMAYGGMVTLTILEWVLLQGDFQEEHTGKRDCWTTHAEVAFVGDMPWHGMILVAPGEVSYL